MSYTLAILYVMGIRQGKKSRISIEGCPSAQCPGCGVVRERGRAGAVCPGEECCGDAEPLKRVPYAPSLLSGVG